MNRKAKYLFVYLKTGGGHLAPARALAAYFKRMCESSIEPVLLDGLEGSPALARFILEDGYRLLQAKARWCYELLYAFNKNPFVAQTNAWLVGSVIAESLRSAIERERPDKIIVLHFFLIQPVINVLRALDMNIPVLIIVTDPFTAHPLWFLNKHLNFIVHSERLKQHCMAQGIAGEHLNVFPLILGEGFSQVVSVDEIASLKKGLGVAPEHPLILLIGGGDGLPRGERILEAIVRAELLVEVVIVCGRNKRLEKAARAIAANAKTHITVYGYSDKVPELINAADVVVLKGGASTVMEVLLLGKLPIVSDYLWEQEKGNVEFLTDNNIGIYENNVKKIPDLLKRYLTNEDGRRSLAERLKRLGLKNGTEDICKFIAKFESPSILISTGR